MRTCLLVLLLGCAADPKAGLFDSTSNVSTQWSWAFHTKTGASIFTTESDVAPHCSNASRGGTPAFEVSTAALAAPAVVTIVAGPLDPSQPQAVVDYSNPPMWAGPYDTGTVELDHVGSTLSGSVDAAISSGATTPCCMPGKCTCWTASFQDTPFCD